MLPGQMSPWQFGSAQDVPRNLLLKFHQNWVSNSWYILDIDKSHLYKCFLESVLNVSKNLPLKFHQNRVSNSWYIVDIEFAVVVGGWVCRVLFMSKPTLGWDELGLWILWLFLPIQGTFGHLFSNKFLQPLIVIIHLWRLLGLIFWIFVKIH